MSREGAAGKEPKSARRAGTPIWVWVVYAFGIVAAAIFAFSLLFTLGALVLSDDMAVTYDVSAPAVLLWGVLMLAAVVTWIVRRRQRR
jgi:hypothetical protein